MKIKTFLAIVFVLYGTGIFAGGASIILKSNDVYIANDKIYLGEIADFEGVSPNDLEKLQVLYVKRAAVPGFKASVEKEYVANRVAKYFPHITVEGPVRVNVHTSKGTITREEIEKTAKDYILTNMPWQLDAAEVIIKEVKGNVSVTEGTVLLKVKDAGAFNYRGNIVIPVEIHVDGRFYRIEPVSAVVKVNAPCAVAQSDINRRAVMGADSVMMEIRDITYLPDIIITDVSFFNNKASVRNILKGTILTTDMFESLPLFRRGSPVDVIARVRAVQVQVEGTAQSDGREGELVRVRLITGKTVEGRVDSSGKVIITK